MNVDILARRCFGDGARCVETAASIHSLSLPLMWPCFLSSSPYLLPFSFSFSLPWQPATSHTLHLFSRPTLISVFVFLRSLRSSPPFLLLLFLFFRFDRFSVGLFFNLRRNAFHGTLEESEEDFRKMKRTGGFWEMFDPDKRSLIVSCTFLRFVFDGTIVSRRWSHIGLR